MCDYSLEHYQSRPAKVGDKLVTYRWPSGTCGFIAINDEYTAVCVPCGAEIAFDKEVKSVMCGLWFNRKRRHGRVAVFAAVDEDVARTHHDTLEFADGSKLLLTHISPGQTAHVLQLPASKSAQEWTVVVDTAVARMLDAVA